MRTDLGALEQSANRSGLIQTQRLFIDQITVDDAPFFLALLNSPGWLRFIGDKNVNDESTAKRFIESRFLSSYEKLGYGYYLVRSREDQAALGICGFTQRADYDNTDFGFAFLPEYTGKGFALEASNAVLKFGVQSFAFDVLDAGTLIDNHPAARLLAKLGFKAIGKMKNNWGHGQLILHRWWRSDSN